MHKRPKQRPGSSVFKSSVTSGTNNCSPHAGLPNSPLSLPSPLNSWSKETQGKKNCFKLETKHLPRVVVCNSPVRMKSARSKANRKWQKLHKTKFCIVHKQAKHLKALRHHFVSLLWKSKTTWGFNHQLRSCLCPNITHTKTQPASETVLTYVQKGWVLSV